MKPLPPAPFTKEDAYVWSVVLTRFQPEPLINRAIALQADRRDAALMLEAQRMPRAAGYLLIGGALCRGWSDGFQPHWKEPSLPSPWTAEDKGIAFRHGRGRWETTLRASGLQADIRDAALMLGAQLQPLCVVHWRSGLDHLILLRGPPVGERLEWLD